MNHARQTNLNDINAEDCTYKKVSLETELSEALYNTMKEFLAFNYKTLI